MFSISLLAMMICFAAFYVPTVSGAGCWAASACIDANLCRSKNGNPQVGLCPGAANIQCCSCPNCMDAGQCRTRGGQPHTGICAGAANIQCCKLGSAPPPPAGSRPVNTMLTNLADILRGAGLAVVEEAGWKTRGHGVMASVKGIVIHHTAGPATGEYPSLRTVRDGTPSLAGPLAQLGLGRSGTWYVIAAGRCYHAGATINDAIYGNSNAIGIEAEGTGLPATNTGHGHWPEVQYQSYLRGVRALKAAYGVPTANVLGHKEVAVPAGRKIDPNFSMPEFRAQLG